MAITIPRPDRQQTTAPLPGGGLNVTPPAAPSTEGVARAAASLFENEFKKANQVAVLDADLQNSRFTTDLLNNPTTGLLNRKGRDVNGIYDEAQTAWSQHMAQVLSGLSNDTQRAAFKNLAGHRWADTDLQLNRYISAENRRYDDETTSAWGKNETERAASSWNDPDVVSSSLGIQHAVLTDYARRSGKPPEWLDDAKRQASSTTHKAVINQMLINNQDELAQAYYKTNKSDIDAADRVALSDKLATAGVDGAAARSAQKLWDRLGPKDDDDPVDLDTLTTEARRTIKDTKTADAAVARLKERASIHSTASASRTQANTDAIWEAHDKGTRAEDIYTMQEYIDLPGSAKQQVRDKLTAYQNAKVPEDKNTEVALATEAMMMPVNATPEDIRMFKATVSAAVAQRLIEPGTGRTIITDAENAVKIDPERRAAIQAVVTRLREDYRNGLMGDDVEGSNEYNKQIEGLYKWSKLNLDRDPSEYYESVSAPYRAGWVKTILDYVPIAGSFVDSTPQDFKARREELQTPALPQPGDIVKGYRFKGGALNDPTNWEEVK